MKKISPFSCRYFWRLEFLPVAVTVLALLLLSLSYGFGWAHPEIPWMAEPLLKQRDQGFFRFVLQFLDLNKLEYSPRPYRPLSSLIQVLDFYLRYQLWHWIPPKATLNLASIPLLLISPFLLQDFLWRITKSKATAIYGTLFYLFNAGTLSLVMMYFRPAKPMANVWIIASLWLFQIFSEHKKPSLRQCWALNAFVFVGYFFDETVLLLWPVLLIYFWRFIRSHRALLLGFLLQPVLYLFFVFVLLPALMTVGPLHQAHFIPFEKFFIPEFYNSIEWFTSTQRLLMGSLGLIHSHPEYSGIQQALYLLPVLCSGLWFGLLLGKKNVRSPLFIKTLLIVALTAFAHCVLMASNQSTRLGLYWYGTYFAIPICILWSLVFEDALLTYTRHTKVLLHCGAVVMLAAMFLNFLPTNAIYHNAHYDGSPLNERLRSHFNGRKSHFSDGWYFGAGKSEILRKLWETRQNKAADCVLLPFDLNFAGIEMPDAKRCIPQN